MSKTTKVRIANTPAVHIRWMISRDMPEVLGIESANFEYPWCEEDFVTALRERNVIGMVAERQDKIVGYMIYGLHHREIRIESFAVHAAVHRQGVGRAMINKLVGKLSLTRRCRIWLAVRETNLDAQLFFKACGFRATRVMPEYESNGEDAYEFVYRLEEANAK